MAKYERKLRPSTPPIANERFKHVSRLHPYYGMTEPEIASEKRFVRGLLAFFAVLLILTALMIGTRWAITSGLW